MECWYRERHLKHILSMFHLAIQRNDPLNAGALYGCLFDMLQTASIYVEGNRRNYKWKRIMTFLHKELDDIQKAWHDYPITIQNALVAKVILYKESRKKF